MTTRQTALPDISPDADDLREFRRLREHYRETRSNGESDECFVAWCQLMCGWERAPQQDVTPPPSAR
jgi:hypothetical protein